MVTDISLYKLTEDMEKEESRSGVDFDKSYKTLEEINTKLDIMAARSDSEKVRNLLKHKGITQSQLAESLSVSQPYISKICSGKKRLSGTVMSAVAGACGVWYMSGFYDPLAGEDEADWIF